MNRYFVLARYFADGAPGPSFNGTGSLVTDFDLQHDMAKALVIQPDGRIVLGGTATIGIKTGLALVRMLPCAGATRPPAAGGLPTAAYV